MHLSDAHIGSPLSLLMPKKMLPNQDGVENIAVSLVRRDAVKKSLDTRFNQLKPDEIFVSGGDLVEMRGRSAEEMQALTEYMCNDIRRRAKHSPDTPFYYVLGNHDGDPRYPFRDALIALSKGEGMENVHVSDYGVLIGDVLYTHGDLATSALDIDQRSFPPDDRIKLLKRDGAEGDAADMYLYLRGFLASNSDFANAFKVLRHNPETKQPEEIQLTAEMLDTLHVMFGHSHAYANMKKSDIAEPSDKKPGIEVMFEGMCKEGKPIHEASDYTLMNDSAFKHQPDVPTRNIDSPYQLKQSYLHYDNGKLTGRQRLFPENTTWKDMARETTHNVARIKSTQGNHHER